MRAAFALFLTLLAAPAGANPSVTAAANLEPSENTRAAMLDYTGARWQPYLAATGDSDFPGASKNVAAGIEYLWHPWRIALGAGAAYVRYTDDDIGTHLNFSLFAEIPLTGAHALACRHLSHGSKLGIEQNKPNSGWSFCGYRYRFRIE